MKNMFCLMSLIAFMSLSCKVCKDDSLSLQKQDYLGNEMRIDGYYYAFDSVSDQGYMVFIFYQNGTFCLRTKESLEQAELDMNSGEFTQAVQDVKRAWGVFQVDSNNLTTESWKLKHCGYPTIPLTGTLVNDSTIEIGNLNFVNNDVLTYKFKTFSPKPDNTNPFV